MAKLKQETLVLDETKNRVSIDAARKVADYCHRADWHFRRGNTMHAAAMLGRAREVLLGVEIPDLGPLRKIFLFVANPPETLRLTDIANLRDDAMEVLMQVESQAIHVLQNGGRKED
jgi:hypothetical protein